MNAVKDLVQTLMSSYISLPTGEMMILLIVLVLCLLTKATRIGLLTAYFFVFRWGWIFFRNNYGDLTNNLFLAYVILGSLIPLLAIIRLWFGGTSED